MKNIFLAILFTIGASATIFARPTTQDSKPDHYHEFEEGMTCRLLADNVNIRESASKKGAVIVNVPLGTEVTIVEQSKEEMTMNGLESSWYKIKLKHEGKDYTGYVWGGLIADGWVESENDPNVIFMFGVASCEKLKEGLFKDYNVKLQIRACKDNKELSKIEFDVAGDLNIWHELTITGGKGISTIKNILTFSESQQMCAGTNANTVIFWDAKKLYYIDMLTPGGDAPMFATDDFIFPEDEGGVKDKIIREQMVGEMGEEEGQDIIESHSKVEYTWTGTELKKGKVLINK